MPPFPRRADANHLEETCAELLVLRSPDSEALPLAPESATWLAETAVAVLRVEVGAEAMLALARCSRHVRVLARLNLCVNWVVCRAPAARAGGVSTLSKRDVQTYRTTTQTPAPAQAR
jgi:hypothetical protein